MNSAGATVNINITGNNSLIQLGDPAVSPASASSDLFSVTEPSNTANTVVIDDSSSTAPSTYTVNNGIPGGSTFPITGPGINFQEPSGIASGGITLKGSSGADTYNVLSTFSGQPVNIVGGAGNNTVNVGSVANKLVAILSPVTVSDPLGSMRLSLLDGGDTTGTTTTITGSSVTGLDFGMGGLVNYTGVTTATGGVTNLNVTDGSTLASTYIVDGTSATTTTLNTGTGADTVDVEATGTGASLIINGDGTDTVNLGSEPATPAMRTLGGIKSLVTVNDATGSATLKLLDAGETASAAGNITGGSVSGLGFGSGGSVDYTGGTTAGVTSLVIDGGTDRASGVTYNFTSTLTDTTLFDGPNANTVDVEATGTSAPLTIYGDGADTVNVGSNPGSPASRAKDTVNVGSNPGSPASSTLGGIVSLLTVHNARGSTTLNLLDAGDTSSAAGTITGSSVSGLGFGTDGSVAYTGGATTGVTSLVIDGGTNGASGVTYNFTSTSTDTTLNDGPDADTVNITGTGVAAGTTLTINDDPDAIVSYNAGGGTPVVTNGAAHGDVVITLAGSGTQGLRTTFSCVFEGFSRELSSHYIINTNCNALYSPIHYRKVANM